MHGQQNVKILADVLRQTNGPIDGLLTFEDGTRWFVPKRRQRITTTRYVKTQKSVLLSKYVVQFRINAFLKENCFFSFLSCNFRVKNAFVLKGSNMGGLPLHKKREKSL